MEDYLPATGDTRRQRFDTTIRHPQLFPPTYPKTKQIQRSNLRRFDFKYPVKNPSMPIYISRETTEKPSKIIPKHLPPYRSGAL